MSNRPRIHPKNTRVLYFPRIDYPVFSCEGSWKERSQRPSEARLKLEALFTTVDVTPAYANSQAV